MLACLGLIHIWEHYVPNLSVGPAFTLVVYALTWVALYATSTLYHASRHLERKSVLRILDHCAIFVVIAGSYGPYVLYAVNDQVGRTLWFLSWVIAIGGCLFKFYSRYRYHDQSTWAYVVQGWMFAVTIPTLLASMTISAFLWLLFGGICLTGGTYFYIHDDVKYNHSLWHVFVVVGSCGFYRSIIEILTI